jgi:hypothetical protein
MDVEISARPDIWQAQDAPWKCRARREAQGTGLSRARLEAVTAEPQSGDGEIWKWCGGKRAMTLAITIGGADRG